MFVGFCEESSWVVVTISYFQLFRIATFTLLHWTKFEITAFTLPAVCTTTFHIG